MPSRDARHATQLLILRYRLGVVERPLAIGLRKIFSYQRRKARELGVKGGQPASVTFTQRFGSTLNIHPHFHHIVGDCVFAQDEDGSVRAVDLPEPSTAEVEKLVLQIVKAVEKRVAKEKPSSDEFENDEDAIMTQAHIESMQQRLTRWSSPTVAPARAPPQAEMFDDAWATGGHATDPP